MTDNQILNRREEFANRYIPAATWRAAGLTLTTCQWDLFFQEEIDEVGAYNVDFHDNDLIPINATLLKPLKRFPQCLADTRAIKSKVSSSRSVNPANSPG